MDLSLISEDTPSSVALVVGAGPTGLVMAAELARYGVPTRIIDKRAQPAHHSRALVIQPRILEIFEDMGIVKEFLEVGKPIAAFNPYIAGRHLSRIEWQNDNTAYAPLILEQSETERILEEYLSELGVNVERRTELIDLRQTENAIATEIRYSSGIKDALVARYVFGCDGAHSVVRKALRLDFAGDRYPEDFILADLKIDWDLADDEVHIFLKDGKVLAALPLSGRGRYRLIASREGDPAPGHEHPAEPTLAEFQQLLKGRLPVYARLKKPEWLAAFRLHHRISEEVRIGRVFLAGDAAHIHSPVGGQGMNTGIQDAYNLAWKVALVETGKVHPELLDTYQTERLPVMQDIVRLTDRAFRAAMAEGFWARKAREYLAPLLLPRGTVRRRVLDKIGQIATRYPRGRFIKDTAPFRDGPRAGMRAPNVDVFDIHRARFLQMFDLFQDQRHVLLFFADGQLEERYLRASRELRVKYSQYVELYLLLPGEKEPSLQEPEDLLLNDPDGEVYETYGVTTSALYLIRPDGHVAFRSLPAERARLEAYLKDVFIVERRAQGVTDLI